jgi:uncharacterized membrane protein
VYVESLPAGPSRVAVISRRDGRLRHLLEALRTNFFVLPAVGVVVGFVAARLAVGVHIGSWAGEATVDSARAVLSTLAAATITFASITFSVALLIIQQGSAQFSPRVIPGLTRDPFNRRVIAIVVGSFTYFLVSLQRVRAPLSEGGEAVVPSFAVSLGVVLGLVSVLAVVAAIHHTAQQMDVSSILSTIVAQGTARRADLPPGLRSSSNVGAPIGSPGSVVRFDEAGWVRQVDLAALIDLAEDAGTVRLHTVPGRYAMPGTIAVTMWPAVEQSRLSDVAQRVRSAIMLGPTRTMADDRTYAVRQLVDVALKALSPGVNDPTTAQDAIFHLGTLLVDRLSSDPDPIAVEDDRQRRVLVPEAVSDDDLADLALAELRGAAADKPAVCRYLLAMIADVGEAVGQHRAEPFTAQAALLLASVEHEDLAVHDRDIVRRDYARRFGPSEAREKEA